MDSSRNNKQVEYLNQMLSLIESSGDPNAALKAVYETPLPDNMTYMDSIIARSIVMSGILLNCGTNTEASFCDYIHDFASRIEDHVRF